MIDDDLETDEAEDHVEQLAECLDIEAERRRWIRVAVAALAASEPEHCSGRVQLAYDTMRIAACERMVRLLGSDLQTPA